ncbi:hypothetical protein CVT24_001793 [Panaeolus cyanescens]|uniref:HSF-type DNA-binding domain-containing protein n=1 Tax=Panaeolus cyanescens TaxID=181874 RepID=A0A409YFS8_9AGAR|nr:hypothetical protein CVT24_001793 [Panaeolus cyanescens]
MASDHQVALTRNRIPQSSSHISKAARQVVPAFLQKLYEMVNDPNNAELIRWSDAGDSFFVLDHERFAHEVLGRWFKHRNFASFVRQLNMYGFHKIPHLQQGVLKSDNDTEFWNFAHVNFHRGQPDLLCLIQRKKPMQGGDDGAVELQGNASNGSTPGGGGSVVGGGTTLPSGQVLDIGSVLAGIQAIKRHQTTISAELNELKRSNELLWQDALAARAKHQKQQDTINRIVKFLAGVFGNQAGGGNGSVGGSPTTPGGQNGKDDMGGSVGLARRRARLMIEDTNRDGPRKSMVEELTEMPIDTDPASYEQNYPTIETPVSAASPAPSVAMSDNISIAETTLTHNDTQPNGPSTPKERTPTPTPPSLPKTTSAPSSTSAATNTTTASSNDTQLFRPVTPSRAPPMLDFNNIGVQNFLNSLTPAQLQGILAQLAAQTFPDTSQTLDPLNTGSNTSNNPSASSAGLGAANSVLFPSNLISGPLTPFYQPHSYDFPASTPSLNLNTPPSSTGVGSGSTTTTATNQVGLQSASQYQNHTPSFPLNLIPSDGLISFDSRDYDLGTPGGSVMGAPGAMSPFGVGLGPGGDAGTLVDPHQHEHEKRVESGWKVADDIDKDVSALNASIDSLITTLGLDPGVLLDAQLQGAGVDSTTGATGGKGGLEGGVNASNLSTSGSGSSTTQPASDFDIDSFFNSLGSSSSIGGMSGIDMGLGLDDAMGSGSGMGGLGGGGDVDMTHAGDMVLGDTAFLDELPDSPATSKGPGSPVNATTTRDLGGAAPSNPGVSPGGMQHTLGMGTRSRKRKSEVVNEVSPADAMAGLQVGGSGPVPQPAPPGGGIKVNLNLNTGVGGSKPKKRKG